MIAERAVLFKLIGLIATHDDDSACYYLEVRGFEMVAKVNAELLKRWNLCQISRT